MHKFLKALTIFVFLLSMAKAEVYTKTPTNLVTKQTYFQITTGVYQIMNVREKKEALNFYTRQEAHLSPVFGLGIGMYINDKVKLSLNVDHILARFSNATDNFSYFSPRVHHYILGSISVNRSASITSLMVNNHYDIYKKDNFSVFIGGGLGVANISETVSLKSCGQLTMCNRSYTIPNNISTHTNKASNNLAYALTAGISTNLNEGIYLDLAYSWKSFGRTKIMDYVNGELTTPNKYQGHVINLGLRFDM